MIFTSLSFFEKTIKKLNEKTDIKDKKLFYWVESVSWKGKVEIMALEPIGTTGSRAYTEVAKNTGNVTKATQTRAAEETAKKQTASTPAANTASASETKGNVTEGKQEEENVSSKIKDALDKVNQKIVPSKTRCEFAYHEDTNRISIKVIDQETEETIKEIPAEETLDMLSKIWEFAGLLVDERR